MKSELNLFKFLPLICTFAVVLAACSPQNKNNVEDFPQSTPNTTEDTNMIKDQNTTIKQTYAQAPEMTIDVDKTYYATLKTNKGDIKIEFFPKDAPKTVNNFVFLAKDDFYDGVIFHRVIPDFMIQGGDPTGTGMGDPGYKFEDEIHASNKNERGTIAMANAGPGTNGSQFFINVKYNDSLDTKHTVFGKVIEGIEVADEISKVQTNSEDKPVEDVVINDVVIEEK